MDFKLVRDKFSTVISVSGILGVLIFLNRSVTDNPSLYSVPNWDYVKSKKSRFKFLDVLPTRILIYFKTIKLK